MSFIICSDTVIFDEPASFTNAHLKARQVSTRPEMVGETVEVRLGSSTVAAYINGIRTDAEDSDPRVFRS